MAKPNVLLICVDHWNGRLIAELGHAAILTPTLNQLVRNGLAYTNAYATTPSCIPARRELMTGVLSPTHGDRVFNETPPMPDSPTFPNSFSIRVLATIIQAITSCRAGPRSSRRGPPKQTLVCLVGARGLVSDTEGGRGS